MRDSDSLVTAIQKANGWFELRVLWSEFIHLLYIDKVHNAFFERIHYLQNCTDDLFELSKLESIKNDVESEVGMHFDSETDQKVSRFNFNILKFLAPFNSGDTSHVKTN